VYRNIAEQIMNDDSFYIRRMADASALDESALRIGFKIECSGVAPGMLLYLVRGIQSLVHLGTPQQHGA
jgi:hypothetical protein